MSTGTSLTTTWTQKGGTITTPVNTARMRVQFINQTNAGWLAVDDPVPAGSTVLGAVVLNLALAINHRPGRYMAV